MAITQVQSQQGSGTGAGPLALAMPGAVTAGNLLLVPTLNFGSGSPPAPSGITDTPGNAFTNFFDETNGGFTRRIECWFAKNILGGADTLSVAMSATGSYAAMAIEVSGLNTAAPSDKFALGTGTGTAADSTATAVTTDANEYLLGTVWCPSSATVTLPVGWTQVGTDIVIGSDRFVVASRIVAATGTYNFAPTLSSSVNWISTIATFKTTGAGPATKLGFGQTPQGAWISGAAGSIQPTVQVQDASGVLVSTDNTTQVVATITKGNGTLVGTTTVTCVGGVATFTNLGLSQTTLADDIFNITFSKVGGGLTAVVSSNIYVCSATVQPAALPQVTINTTMPTRTGLLTRVAAGNLQAAINAAAPGDWLVLDHTVTYTGDFVLPAKVGADAQPGGNGVVVIISDAIVDFGFLPRNKRVGPADAPNMPKIRTTTANGVCLSVTLGVPNMGGYRIVGCDIGPAVGNTADMTRIVRFGDEVTLVNNGANQPFNMGLDRCYIHCDNATQNIQHGVSLHSSYSFAIDSYIENIHHNGADAQAIWCGQQAVGVLIQNNFLEATGENLFFGGSDGIDGFPCTDIVARYNYLFKRKTWNPQDASYAGVLWVIKNIFEIKFGRRMLVEFNILDGVWNGAQVGFAMLIKSNNVEGIPTTDVTVRYNYVRNAAGFFNFNGQLADTAPVGSFPPWMARANIHDNLADTTVGSALYDPTNQVGMMAQLLEHTCDLVFEHNTSLPTRYFLGLNDPTVPFNVRFAYNNNLGQRGTTGVKAGGQVEGTASLNSVTYPNGNYTFAGNVIAGAASGSYPAGNFFPLDVAAIGLEDATLVSNGSLTAGSIYKGVATDGKDPGVDWATLSAGIANVVSGDFTGGAAGSGGKVGGRRRRTIITRH